MKAKLLICNCGECAHWEVIHKDDGTTIIKCVSCQVEYPARVEVDPHENLHYMEHK